MPDNSLHNRLFYLWHGSNCYHSVVDIYVYEKQNAVRIYVPIILSLFFYLQVLYSGYYWLLMLFMLYCRL